MDRTRRQVLHMVGAAAVVTTGFGLGLWRKWARGSAEPAATAPARPTTSAAPPPTAATTMTAPTPSTVAPTTTTTTPTTSSTSTSTTTTSTTLPPAVLEVIERAGWGAGGQRGDLPAHTVERITVHHSAGVLTDNREAPERILGYQRFHQERGFVDLAYHFAIDVDGNVYEGRDPAIPGETFTSYDPTGHFLPMCIGNFEEQPIGEAQLGALVDLIAWAVGQFGAGVDTITGHRDHAATACPGEALYALVVDGTLAARVTERLNAGGVELAFVRGGEALDRVAAIRAGDA